MQPSRCSRFTSSDRQDSTVLLGLDVEERAQRRDRPAGYRCRQRPHPSGAAESHRRIVDDTPARGVDLDRAPRVVGEIEVELFINSANPDMHHALRRIEMRLGLDHVERRLQCIRTRGALGFLEEASH
jgi:hypothetical protein